jgi:hypothetical protein
MPTTISGTTGITTAGVDSGTPVIDNRPVFSAYTTVLQTVTTGVSTKNNFAVEEFDTNSNYDTSTSVFTAAIDGYYQFSASIRAISSTTLTQLVVTLYVNGSGSQSLVNHTFPANTATLVTASSKPVYLAVGDYTEIYVTAVGTGTLQLGGTVITNTSNFSGFLVGAV